jgi:hypothetical protein
LHETDADVQPAVTQALQLPEIVMYILSKLVSDDDITYQSNSYHPTLHPCLLVSKLWYSCAVRLLWKHVVVGSHEALDKYGQVLFDSRWLGFASGVAGKTSGVDDMDVDLEPTDAIDTSPMFQRSDRLIPNYQGCLGEQTQQLTTQLSQSVRSFRCQKLTNISAPKLRALSCTMPVLTLLEFYVCKDLDNEVIIDFARYCGYTLNTIKLPGCAHISDSAVLAIGKFCSQLLHLDLRACSLVSDASIQQVANKCLKLKYLNVGRFVDGHAISDNAIHSVAKLPAINTIGLAGCHVSDVAVFAIAQHASKVVQRLSLNSCPHISNKSLAYVVANMKCITVLEVRNCPAVTDVHLITLLLQRGVRVEMCDRLQYLLHEQLRLHFKNKNDTVQAPES